MFIPCSNIFIPDNPKEDHDSIFYQAFHLSNYEFGKYLWKLHRSILKHPETLEECESISYIIPTHKDCSPTLKVAIVLFEHDIFERGGEIARKFYMEQWNASKFFNEAMTGKERQKHKASRPRQDRLGEIIEDIVKKNPNIKHPELVMEIEKLRGQGVIETVSDSEIEWRDGEKTEGAPISGLKDRLSRAKKKNQK